MNLFEGSGVWPRTLRFIKMKIGIVDRPRIKFEGDNKERHEAFHCYTRNNSESSALMKINILDPTK